MAIRAGFPRDEYGSKQGNQVANIMCGLINVNYHYVIWLKCDAIVIHSDAIPWLPQGGKTSHTTHPFLGIFRNFWRWTLQPQILKHDWSMSEMAKDFLLDTIF